jgi:predicted nucleotide-binding protein
VVTLISYEELFALAEKLKKLSEGIQANDVAESLSALESAANSVARSFSGSWQGYHSRVYYSEFVTPPAGAHFSQEWGLMDSYSLNGSPGDWREYTSEAVKSHIDSISGKPSIEPAKEAAAAANKTFSTFQSEVVSILHSELDSQADGFLDKLKTELEELKPLSTSDVVRRIAPQGGFMTRDTVTIGQGMQTPPHIAVSAEVLAIKNSFGICRIAGDIATKAASHLERKFKRNKRTERIGTNVFIGHGRSHVWRDLKDFVQDRLQLPWDEFNRVPVAGVTNIARLSEMLDSAAIAFLVMTAEDETVDGKMQARMNVVHEAGLFQGRLGFMRAIVLLEEGCEQFSNIDGLGQIRFPSGNISGAFEDIRRVLEREGLISPI